MSKSQRAIKKRQQYVEALYALEGLQEAVLAQQDTPPGKLDKFATKMLNYSIRNIDKKLAR